MLASLGRDGEAEEIFRRCIGDPATENTILLEALSEYGRFLAARGRLQDAVRCFLRGLDITRSITSISTAMRSTAIWPTSTPVWAVTIGP